MLRVLLLGVLLTGPLMAQEPSGSDALAGCLADNTTGRDRKDLAHWLFLAIAAHPELQPLAGDRVPAAREDVNRTIAALLTRLLTEDCPAESRAAMTAQGPLGLEEAFKVLGELAMQEVMSDEGVNRAILAFTDHLDEAKLSAVLNGE